MEGVWQRLRAAQGGESGSQPPPCAEDAWGVRAPQGRRLLAGTGQLLYGVNVRLMWDRVGWGGPTVSKSQRVTPGDEPECQDHGKGRDVVWGWRVPVS